MIKNNSFIKNIDFSNLTLGKEDIKELMEADVSLLNKINIKPRQINIREIKKDINKYTCEMEFECYGVTLKEYCESKASLRSREIINILWHISNGRVFSFEFFIK